jgi:hypothetical protein
MESELLPSESVMSGLQHIDYQMTTGKVKGKGKVIPVLN